MLDTTAAARRRFRWVAGSFAAAVAVTAGALVAGPAAAHSVDGCITSPASPDRGKIPLCETIPDPSNPPVLSISTTEVTGSDTVTLSGTGFDAGNELFIRFNDLGALPSQPNGLLTTNPSPITVGSDGTFSAEVTLPSRADIESVMSTYGTADIWLRVLGSAPAISLHQEVMLVSEVTPAAPTQSGNTVTIPDTTGVVYSVGGSAVTGSIDITADTTVTAAAAAGYVLAGGATTSWTFAYDGGGSGPTDPSLTGEVTVTVGIPAETGALALSLTETSVDLGDAALNSTADAYEASGLLPLVTVTDTRTTVNPGWSLAGQSSDFSTSGSDTLAGSALGWTPEVVSTSDGQTVTAGATVEAGTGFTGGAVLGSAESGQGVGTAQLGANLRFTAPTTTAPGEYTATITLTLS